ncbi:radical SAM protein [Embleya sp. NPDC020886]|uniref:radical SAM protein n=1 Tax=Embleya sp. NPDC020886 TaxID=3363980 RepID=UPI003795C8BF
MTTVLDQQTPPAATQRLKVVRLTITHACQASCVHCFNKSGPQGTAGSMALTDWLSVLDQGAALGATQTQISGGEATLNPNLPDLVHHALKLGMWVEVFSNLIHVREPHWATFRHDGVSLGFSYYSDLASQHEKITRQRGSYERTKANVRKAVEYRIPLRASIVDILEGQRITEAEAELRALGVTRIGIDRQRAIGRAAVGDTLDPGQLCGHCTDGQIAIGPDGDVSACPMSAQVVTGNAHTQSLETIIGGQPWRALAKSIPRRLADPPCQPKSDSCAPNPGVRNA